MKVTPPNPIVDFITSGGNGQLTFVIPVYQRNYEWTVENCDQFFDDIKNSIPVPGTPEKFHYFGNIVYDFNEAERDPFNGYVQYILIDGQQRITSTMLFLAALRDEEKDAEAKDNIDATYLKNQTAKEEYKIKLKQIEMDRATFTSIVERDLSDINKNSAIYKNYMRFRSLIKTAKEEGITSKDLLLGLRAMNVIAINLESKTAGAESPQVIFESINATGKRLSDADLLRNYLLFEIGLDKQEQYYNDYWLKIEQRVGNSNISDFLRRYLTMRLHHDIKSETEYATFKKKYHDLFGDAEAAMSELVKYSKYYQWIKQPETLENEETAELLHEADLLRLIPATSVFMWLLDKVQTNVIEFSEFNNILRVIMSWSFRARVTGIIATGEIGNILNTGIQEILEAKPDDGKSYSEYLHYELSNYRTHDIYATDKQFKEAFVHYNFYKNYGRYTQEKLSKAISNDRHILFESIEHILPQTLDQQKWPDISIADHAEWVNTIGNLVPMNQSDNTSNSNDDIAKKTQRLEVSDWLLARQALDYKINGNWTIESIKNRANDLAKEAVKIWQGPEKRTRDIEAPTRGKVNENMVKLVNLVRNFNLPNIIVAPNQERNACYFNFHTETMNDIYRSETGGDLYTYSIVMEDGRRWDHVNLTICNYKPEILDEHRRKVHNTIIGLTNREPKETWLYFKAARWDNVAEDESEDEATLYEILSEKIPAYEQHLKELMV